MGQFKIINKVIKVTYRLDLLLKIKIHLVYYITKRHQSAEPLVFN